MSSHVHTATIGWQRAEGAAFVDHRYSRAHRWSFDGGLSLPASSSPQVVRLPFSDPAAIDPEEAYVAALASCHMLWFLDLAARAGLVVEAYDDQAQGYMARNAAGKDWVARVELAPAVRFAGEAPSVQALADLHHRAHAECYLANSVRTEVVVREAPAR